MAGRFSNNNRSSTTTGDNQVTEVSPDTVTINGVEYVRADTVSTVVTDANYVIVRGRDAGVFAGDLQSRTGDEVQLANARRIWYWAGAATLSELALKGTSKPNDCKFPAAVPSITLLGVCEVIPATQACRESIASVKEWNA